MCVCASPTLGQLQAGAPWPAFGHDSARTGHSPFGSSASGWNSTLQTNYDDHVSSPAIGSDGTVYVATDYFAIALNGSTGAVVWRYNYTFAGGSSGSSYINPIIGSDGTVYTGCVRTVVALNGSTGALIWSFSSNSLYPGASAAMGSNSIVYCVTSNVTALNGFTGALIWSRQWSEYYTCSPPTVGVNGILYVACFDEYFSYFFALNGLTGAVIWKYYRYQGNVWSYAVGRQGTVYVTTNGRLYALNGLTGALIWNGNIEEDLTQGWSSLAIASDGTVLIGGYTNDVFAFDDSTGAPIWNYTNTSDNGASGTGIAVDSPLIIISFDSIVYALNESTGTLVWSLAVGGAACSSPALASDGTVYVTVLVIGTYVVRALKPPVSAVTLTASVTPSPSPTGCASPSVFVSHSPSTTSLLSSSFVG